MSIPVSVISSYNHQTNSVMPKKIFYHNREHTITALGLHHTFKTGQTLFHVFSVTSSSTFFRLILNTENLHWTLEEITDNDF